VGSPFQGGPLNFVVHSLCLNTAVRNKRMGRSTTMWSAPPRMAIRGVATRFDGIMEQTRPALGPTNHGLGRAQPCGCMRDREPPPDCAGGTGAASGLAATAVPGAYRRRAAAEAGEHLIGTVALRHQVPGSSRAWRLATATNSAATSPNRSAACNFDGSGTGREPAEPAELAPPDERPRRPAR
jgi:hypothetical protein